MTPFFKKALKADEIFERQKKLPDDDEYKVQKIGFVLRFCKGKDKQIGYKVIDEVLKISKAPIKDLNGLLYSVRDNELGAFIVDKIAGYGMEKKEVHETLWSVGSDPGGGGNRGARNKAREHYDRYYDRVTGGNPLKKPDLLIPDW
jgi:hypothetical protein